MYTGVIDYFATGEGRSVWVARVGGATIEQAKEHFKNSFKSFDDVTFWDYFSIGLDVYDDGIKEERAKAKKILDSLLKRRLVNSLFTEYIDWSMKLHYNFS